MPMKLWPQLKHLLDSFSCSFDPTLSASSTSLELVLYCVFS
jgi:hypothetical protein